MYLYINGKLDASENGFASNSVIESDGVIVLGQVRRLKGIPPISANFQGHTTNKKFSISLIPYGKLVNKRSPVSDHVTGHFA